MTTKCKASVTGIATHHRTHETIWVLLELFQSIRLTTSPLDKLCSLSGPDILEDAAELVGRRWSFSDVQLESFSSCMMGLMAVIGSLILSGCLGSLSRGLLEQVRDADGRGSGGFVEEGDHVEGLVLLSLAR